MLVILGAGAAIWALAPKFKRHKADPGPTDVARLLPIAYAASALLIAMSVLLIYADIVNPISLG